MSYTSFGEFVRIMRIKHHEVMGDLAKVLDCPVPFLSAVENGKKNIPSTWKEILINHYSLTPEQQSDLETAIEESKTQYKILTVNAGQIQRKAAMQFARSFDKMDDKTAEKVLALLSKQEEQDN